MSAQQCPASNLERTIRLLPAHRRALPDSSRAGCGSCHPHSAFSWSAIIITGLGGTDLYPSQDNVETALVTMLVVFGAIMWAKVLATFCDLATNSDPSAVEYRQALDDLNRFCNSQGLSVELKRRLRQYFHQRKHIMVSWCRAHCVRYQLRHLCHAHPTLTRSRVR